MTPDAILNSATQIYISMPCQPAVAVDRANELAALVERGVLAARVQRSVLAASGVADDDGMGDLG